MRIQAILKRILLQRRGDKRTLALLFAAPIVIISLLYLLLQTTSDQTYRVGLVKESDNTALTTSLKKSSDLEIVEVNDSSRKTMNDENLEAIVAISDDTLEMTFLNKDSGVTQRISSIVATSARKMQETMTKQKIETLIESAVKSNPVLADKLPSIDLTDGTSLKIKTHYLYGDSNLSMFDSLAPILVCFFVFFFVFLISGISLVNERSSGTLIRMLISPVKRSEIIKGYTLAYGLLAVVQTMLIILWTRFVLQMTVVGSFIWVIVLNLLIALIALLIGLLLSALAKTEFQFIQFVPVVVVTQFLFSGVINVDTMAQPLQWIAHVMPLYYGVDALQKVIKQGLGVSAISLDLAVLLTIVILLYLLNVAALKNLRRI